MVEHQNDNSSKEELTPGGSGGEDPVNEGGSGIARRSYLQIAGVAAAGSVLASSRASASNGDLPNAIVFDGTNTSEPTEYSFTVSDSVEAASVVENTNDDIFGQTVQGTVNGGANAYVYSGTIQQLSNFGPGTVQFGNDSESILPEPTHRIVVRSGSEISYEFTANGEVTKVKDGSETKAEDNDDITQNGDGTWSVSGYTGNGYGDAFRYRGNVTDFSPLEGPYTLVVDGEETTAYDLTGTERPSDDELVITSSTEVSYQFKTDAKPKKIQDGSRNEAEDNDDVTRNDDGTWTVSGYTGNGYGDGYELTGEVLEFSPMTGSYSLLLNGEDTTAYELTGTEPPEPGTDAVLGGGEGYANTVPVGDADYTVSSTSELENALGSASSGDVVYLVDDVSASSTLTLPRGVTLASDRGINGSPGSKLRTNKEIPLLRVQGNNRITGLVIQGPMTEYESWDGYPAGWGIETEGSGVEIDNVEGFGFAYSAVRCGADTHVHHCNLHDNPQEGLGYGVDVSGGHPVIEYCKFDGNRHSVAAGSGDRGYTLENTWIGPKSYGHPIDHHGPQSGSEVVIRNVTVEATEDVTGDTKSVSMRDDDMGRLLIENCWFYLPKPDLDSNGGNGTCLKVQPGTIAASNTTMRNNHYDSSEPDANIGHPR